MIVDRLTKQHLYEPLETLQTTKFIDAMYWRVFITYGFPLTTVNNRESQITSTLWKKLCKRYGINIKFSSVHHPETDDQIENANKVIKNYLYEYINHTEDNWVDNLPMAEFAASNYVNLSMGVMPFFADYGFHPRTNIEPLDTYEGKQKAELLATDKIVKRQAKMMIFLED